MSKHLLCLTIDTDPDGLSGIVTNRQTLKWSGLEHLQNLPETLGNIPISWFVRADGQLESILGSATYLLERYASLWTTVRSAGHELAWHPHLYRQLKPEDEATLIAHPNEASEELDRLWGTVRTVLPATSFRNGEGWHSPETYATIERLGFRCDSTAIPGRKGAAGHPMNWEGVPNQPYFPSPTDMRKAGRERSLLELPMNTWMVKALHDTAPRLRYINPAVHSKIFANALRNWENTRTFSPSTLHIWVMIFHPDEVSPAQGEDGLYSRSTSDLSANLACFLENLQRAGQEVEWVTVAQAADRWRQHQEQIR